MLTAAVWVLLLLLAGVAGSTLVTLAVLVRLPADAFSESRRPWPRTLPHLLSKIGMNVVGWALILLAMALSMPGVPGQGLLTILAGILLVDFPGRNRLLRRLMASRGIRSAVDRLRVRFGRPPFL